MHVEKTVVEIIIKKREKETVIVTSYTVFKESNVVRVMILLKNNLGNRKYGRIISSFI